MKARKSAESLFGFFSLFQLKHFPGDHLKLVRHHNTIGGFYNHILNALGYLTNCGMDNSIFTGDKNEQVDYGEWSVHGHTLKVYDYHTAVEAIENIIEQGEGSSPCNPVAWDIGSAKGLSHYFLFNSVVEEREIIVAAADENRDTLVIRFLIDSFVYSYTWTNFGRNYF